MAHLRAATGDMVAAIALLDEAERVYVGDFAPNVRPISAARARMLVAAGDITAALRWARDRRITATDDLTYQREYEHLTLSRVLLAEHTTTRREASLTGATAMLDRLLAAAEAGGRTGSAIEALTLQALARDAAGSREQALTSLEAALRYAESEGYVEVFTIEGPRMLHLLQELDRRHRDWTPVQHVLAACAQDTSTSDAPAATTFGTTSLPRSEQKQPAPPQLVDPLSSRELDVLRYLRSDLDGPAIARELGVSLSTVRTHTQHIYVKLGVTNRRAAVRRAHQLNLNIHAVAR
jgi:LuxR family transcriptional regulator, maltose regulon positive regulatory protein